MDKQNFIIEVQESKLTKESTLFLVNYCEAMINVVAQDVAVPLELHAHREILHTMNELGIAASMINHIDYYTGREDAEAQATAIMLQRLVEQLDKTAKRVMLLSYTINQVLHTGETTNEETSPA